MRNENDNCLRMPFRKMSGKTLAARGFEPPWGKRKVPAFVSKAGTSYGGELGIRTLGAFRAHSISSFVGRTPFRGK